jgi:hypothetical protein
MHYRSSTIENKSKVEQKFFSFVAENTKTSKYSSLSKQQSIIKPIDIQYELISAYIYSGLVILSFFIRKLNYKFKFPYSSELAEMNARHITKCRI